MQQFKYLLGSMNDAIFIDDSGSKLWDIPYAQDFVDRPPVRNNDNRNFWMKNYFVLAGIFVDSDTISKLNPIINKKKEDVFGTKHVEIHSSDLRNPHQKRKKYIEEFGVTDNDLKGFIEDFWYPLIEDNPQMKIQAIVLDKRYFKNQRNHSPLMLTAQALFDRVELGPNKTSLIIFDQMEEALKSEKREQGDILKIANNEIDMHTFFRKYSHTRIIFEKSKNSNFLQIADTVAYNIFRQFVDYGDKWDGADTIVDTYPYFEKVFGNFYCREGHSQPKGVGITKLPDPNSFLRK